MRMFLERFSEVPPTITADAIGTETFTKAAPGDQDNDVSFGGYASIPLSSDPLGSQGKSSPSTSPSVSQSPNVAHPNEQRRHHS